MPQSKPEFSSTPGVPALLRESDTRIIREIPLYLIDEPLNPMRHDMDDEKLRELMSDIREHGLLQNLCVVPLLNGERIAIFPTSHEAVNMFENDGGRYRVAAGHRRLLAMRAINFERARCLVFCDPKQSEYAIMAIENTSREEPTDFDLAVMYSEWSKEPGILEKELERRAGKSITFIYARIDLLKGWDFVSEALHKKQIKFDAARVLNTIDEEPYARMFLNMAIDQGATGRRVALWVSEHKTNKELSKGYVVDQGIGGAVVVAQPAPTECILCGEARSYMLRTVLLCAPDIDRVKKARTDAEAAATPAPQNGHGKI